MPLVTEMGRMQYSNIICCVHKNASADSEKCLINSNFSSGEAERAGRRDGEREGRKEGSRKEGGRRYQGKEIEGGKDEGWRAGGGGRQSVFQKC